MTSIRVQAGQSMLEGFVKRPSAGLCELIWNAFDEDAETVSITAELNDLGGLDRISVADDGGGFNRERAEIAFSTVGDSWKRMPGSLTSGKRRPVHGRHGRGRYAAFGLGRRVEWRSISHAVVDAELQQIVVVGSAGNLQQMDIADVELGGSSTGTTVSVSVITDEAIEAFEEIESLRNHVLTEFALHLERFEDFTINFLGDDLDASSAIESRSVIPLDLPVEIEGAAEIVVIEWKLSGVERRLYLCTGEGSIVDEIPPGVQAPGAEFTAYLKWKVDSTQGTCSHWKGIRSHLRAK